MQSPIRRAFPHGLAAVPLGLWLAGQVHAATLHVGYDLAIHEPPLGAHHANIDRSSESGHDRSVGPDGRGGGMMVGSTARAATSPRPAARTSERVGAARPVELGAQPVRTALTLEPGTPASALDPTGRRRTYLIVKDLHTWEQPEVLYHVYLTPRGGRPETSTYAGTINFFDAEFHDHGDPKLDEALGENFYSFDVTDVLKTLAGRRSQNAATSLDVVLVPGGRPTPGAKPLVGTVHLVWQ